MHQVVADSDHFNKKIVNVDLTEVTPASLHPDVLSREVSVLDALADVDTTTVAPLAGDALVWDGTSWKPKAISTNSWYREAFAVGTVPATLTVVHNLAVDVVSVTVIRRGSPNVVVTPRISALDVNTVEVAIEGGPVGDYEVLVLSEGGSGGGATPPLDDYLPLTGGTLTGPLNTAVINASGTINANAGILVGSGDRIDFPSQADVPKIHLYGTTFGLGVTSGTMNLFASSTIKFQQNSITGTEWARFSASGLGPRTLYTVNYANGFSGTTEIFVTPAMVTLRMTDVSRNADTAVGAQTKIFDFPSGVPAPPNAGTTGWRSPVASFTTGFDLGNNTQHANVMLHIDGTAVWLMPLGDVFYNAYSFCAVVSWPR